MKFFITILVPLIWCLPAFAQPPVNNAKTDTAKQKYILEYDSAVLRVKGNSLPIGIVAISDKGQRSQTKGFLNGTDNWSKYKIDVDSAVYSNGKIKIKGSGNQYKKDDSLTVNVYTKKRFLFFGGTGKWLFSQKIPYNYETNINVLTTGNFSKAPGDHVQFGVRTYFDNKMFLDKWAPAKKNLKDFEFKFDGVHLSKSKGDLKIDDDPTKINNDKISLMAFLAKNATITDTLNVLLDYIANYQCNILSGGAGHNLNVTAAIFQDSIINAQLLKIQVNDAATRKTYNYWVNTNGGSIAILSRAADGSDGLNGLDGSPGTPGLPGTTTVDTETTTNADGSTTTTTTTTTTVTGAGGDGGTGQDRGNGQDGEAGGNGGNIVVNYSPEAAPFLNLIKVTSIAGSGGYGGRGGKGGAGGSGGIGNPNGNAGSNGSDGRNGFGGYDGSRGSVTFIRVGSVQ